MVSIEAILKMPSCSSVPAIFKHIPATKPSAVKSAVAEINCPGFVNVISVTIVISRLAETKVTTGDTVRSTALAFVKIQNWAESTVVLSLSITILKLSSTLMQAEEIISLAISISSVPSLIVIPWPAISVLNSNSSITSCLKTSAPVPTLVAESTTPPPPPPPVVDAPIRAAIDEAGLLMKARRVLSKIRKSPGSTGDVTLKSGNCAVDLNAVC